MRSAEQHRLPAQHDPGLAVIEHAVGDTGLHCFVLYIGQEWPLRRDLGRIKGLRDLLAGAGDHRVRGIEDRLGRAVIALKRDDRGGWGEMVGKVENIPNGCRAVRIDRQASALAGKAGSRSGQAEFAALKVEQIRRIGAIENGEGRVEPDRRGVEA